MPMTPGTLPADITVFERGWLSSNNILLAGRAQCALIDSGYVAHAAQTVALVQSALQGRALDVLVNTHLHSDHCGGNAALQASYPQLQTHIPPGHAGYVRNWDPQALTYTPTGQRCAPFGFDALLQPGTDLRLGQRVWQVHAAPGHDPHSVILFEPVSRVLVSADALWERGFGVVFPELEGVDAFDEVARTLDLIESLAPAVVIPGHGAVFTHVALSIRCARERLAGFAIDRPRHIQHAAKVLLKFHLLEVQTVSRSSLLAWARQTAYFARVFEASGATSDFSCWIGQLVQDLVRAGAAVSAGDTVSNG